MKRTRLRSIVLAGALLPAFGAGAFEIDAGDQPLGEVLQSISRQTGTEIVLADGLANDRVTAHVSEPVWSDAIRSLLAHYNYETVAAPDGNLMKVIVSGRNGNAAAAGTAVVDLLQYQPAPAQLPEKFREMTPGSVVPVEIPRDQLLAMAIGERVSLTLPNGQYEVVHDNRYQHENGDVSWVGYLDNAGKAYRVTLTFGAQGSVGQAVTPEGAFNLEEEDGRTWLVDLNASGLQLSALENDDADPAAAGEEYVSAEAKRKAITLKTVKATIKAKIKANAKAKANNKAIKKTASATAAAGNAAAQPVVDLMVLYTVGVKPAPTIATRINNLVAKANQAYLDSGINLKLRVVYSAPVNYTETNSNNSALSDLTLGRSVFSKVDSLRARYGADLVTLIRPFRYKSQLSCGVAWVNGASGKAMKASFGYSVVSDGTDAAGGYYCSDFTLVHELGHNMGSAHDAAHSSVQGKYPYSYGYGASGKFGTIMSYYNPLLGLFSSPSLSHNGQPLGNDAADNVRSLNQTAGTVAGFLRSVVD